MRFEVPQFIEVEDKIIGPFTWRQFIYLAGGGGTALILFLTLPLILFALIGLPIMVLAGFLAFHRVNNRPFSDFLESSFNYLTKNKLYFWRKRDQTTIVSQSGPEIAEAPSLTQYLAPGPPPPQHLPSPSANNIASLSRKLELSTLEQKQQ